MTRLRFGAVLLFLESGLVALSGLAALPLVGFLGDGGDQNAVVSAMLLELGIVGVGVLMIVLSVLVFRGNKRVAWAGVVFSGIYAMVPWLPQSDRGLLINALTSVLFAIPAVYLMLGLLAEKPISRAAQRGHSSMATEPVPRDPR